MSKISVITSDTINRRIMNYLVIGVLGLGAYKSPQIYKSVSKYFEETSRIVTVEKYIKENEFEASRELLKKFKEEKTISAGDISELEVKLSLWENRYAEKLKREGEYAKKKIEEDKRKAELEASSANTISFITKPKLNTELGRPIEDILDDARELVTAKFKPYIVLENLDILYQALQERGEKTVDQRALDQFLGATSSYLFDFSLPKFFNLGFDPYSKGTPVVVKDRLGNNGSYRWNETPSDIPIGTEGTYVRDSGEPDEFHLININGNEHWFSAYELIAKVDLDYFVKLRKLNKIINEIRDFFGENREYCSSDFAEEK